MGQRDFLEGGIANNLHRVRVLYIIKVISEIRNELGGRLNILDLGCGDGTVTKYILKSASPSDKITGIDIDEDNIKTASSCCPCAQFIAGNLEEVNYEENSTDVIIMHHVIECVDDNVVMEKCRKILKKGGYLILGIPIKRSFSYSFLKKIHPDNWAEKCELNFYSINEMKKILKLHGFTNIKHRNFGILFPYWPIHYAILKNKIAFCIGNFIAKIFSFAADSVIFVAKKYA